MVNGLWFMVYGLWFMVYGLWFMVYGSWFMVKFLVVWAVRPVHGMLSLPLKPPLRVRSDAEGLARGQLAELHFWKSREVFPYHSQPAKTFSSFTVISFVDSREGAFMFRSRLRRSFEVSLIG
jgi:hypothetical protein